MGGLTSGSTVGSLTVCQSRIRSTPEAPNIGGQPCHSLPRADVGWDVHIETMAVAYVANDHSAEVVYHGTSGTRPCDLDTRIRTLQSKRQPRVFVYEAGPGGDWL